MTERESISNDVYTILTLSSLTKREILDILEEVKARVELLPFLEVSLDPE